MGEETVSNENQAHQPPPPPQGAPRQPYSAPFTVPPSAAQQPGASAQQPGYAQPQQPGGQQPGFSASQSPYGYGQAHYAPPRQPYGQAPYGAPQQPYGSAPYAPPVVTKDHVSAGLLAVFLGVFGVHKFYLGYNTAGFIMLAITILGSIFTIGLAAGAMFVISLIEGVTYLSKSQSEFDAVYVVNKKEWF